jgi:hypothetical protein
MKICENVKEKYPSITFKKLLDYFQLDLETCSPKREKKTCGAS